MENKGEALPSPISSGSSGKKSTRKEEQYRQMFSELEKYVVAHSSNSSKHYAVLECLMQVRNKPMPVRREAESEASLASRELERYQAMTERERLEFNMERGKDPAVKTEHYGGASSSKKPRMMGLGGKNLLQIYMERLER